MEQQNSKSYLWRIVTAVVLSALLSINGFILAMVRTDVHNIDTKLFTHLTNAELHAPRTQIVSKAEFEMYRRFKEKETDAVVAKISEMKNDLLNKIDNITVSRR